MATDFRGVFKSVDLGVQTKTGSGYHIQLLKPASGFD